MQLSSSIARLARGAAARPLAAAQPQRGLSAAAAAASGDPRRRPLPTPAHLLEQIAYTEPPNLRVVTLNRPEALNALTLPMLRRLTRLLLQWEKNESVGAVVIGTDSKAFCAGGDVAQVYRDGLAEGKGSAAQLDFFAEEYAFNRLLATSTKPTVALLDGIVMGGGAGVSVHGDFRVATERSLFAMPETAIGLFPDVGASHFLPRLAAGPAVGAYVALTGARLGWREMLSAGLATHALPSSRLPALLAHLGDMGPTATRGAIDAALADYEYAYYYGGATQADADAADPVGYQRRAAEIERVFGAVFEGKDGETSGGGDGMEGVMARLREVEGGAGGGGEEAREWATATATTLGKMSPTSLKVTLRLLAEGAAKEGVEQCLAMELGVVTRMMQGEDFYEGIRAMLIDKDHAPKWAETGLEAVSDAAVDEYFAKPVKIADLRR